MSLIEQRWLRWLCVCCCMMIGGGVWNWFDTRPDGRVHVIFPQLAGDSVLIQTPHGHTILVDGGRDAAGIAALLGEKLPFWQRSIDLLIVTYADGDRVPGALAVARRYHVKQAVLGQFASPQAQAQALLTELQAGGTTLQATDQPWTIDGVELQLIQDSSQDGGLVLFVRYGTATFLLAPRPDDQLVTLIEQHQLQAYALWWPWEHDDDRIVAELLKAQVVIYSAHQRDHWHPRSWLARGGDQRQLLHEKIHGTITLSSDGRTIQVHTTP